MIPSGAIALWGSSPSSRATSFDGREVISAPSRKTPPRRGLSSRASARSSVVLPQAFGPTITVNESSGISMPSRSATTRWS